MANERHQEHGGQETVQGPNEEVHGQKEVAGNEGVPPDRDAASHVCFIQALFPVCLASLQKCLNLFLK